MKRRTHRSSKHAHPHKDHPRHGGARRGPRPPRPAKKAPLVAPPDTVWAQASHVGGKVMARIFHKELSNLSVFIENPPEGLVDGEVLQIRPGKQDRWGQVHGQVVSRHGENPAGLASLVACTNYGLDLAFPDDVVREAEALDWRGWESVRHQKREDWRAIPFVTIDGADARDFDDAVWVDKPNAEGIYDVRVAIADVAHFIEAGSRLDEEAFARGNSTYFPDRVIPMLPEKLSNDLCSLRPHEERAVLGAMLRVDSRGKLVGHRFVRAVIKSSARLTYDTVQDVLDGTEKSHPREADIRRLDKVFKLLLAARERRGSLDLDIGESKLEVNERGEIVSLSQRPRRDAERLIEEMMITANVAAAEALSATGYGIYRVHDIPTKEKVENLRMTLGPLGFNVPSAEAGHKAWAALVETVKRHPAKEQLMRAVLQTQQQARYDPLNIGHYGLALPLYTHFTSPIRRYSDLVVHRALIEALRLAGDGGGVMKPKVAAKACEAMNLRERISQQAEWEARDRMVVQYFAKLEGKVWKGTVVSIQKFGLFVSAEGAAEGLLPMEALLDAGYSYIMRQNLWKRGKEMLRLGAVLPVTLAEADRVRGRITWALAEGNGSRQVPEKAPEKPHRRPWRKSPRRVAQK